MEKFITSTLAILGITFMSVTMHSQVKTNASIREADSLMAVHHQIEEAMNYNGYSYSDAIDLTNLEFFYEEFKKQPTSYNYERFIDEEIKISQYESDLAASK